ncbi:hypothetical protein [Nocardia sp. CDC160]|uniref:hypothetical protein n=1 Tax=Nocardia sp. CDC160 TaxID=3112166 RepID=UPI002DBD2764|nr:hypothetical protein [Nocardia sp. CDC160]MEC3920257.1 hypothetical protein [Nocardia sp. CDC160]
MGRLAFQFEQVSKRISQALKEGADTIGARLLDTRERIGVATQDLANVDGAVRISWRDNDIDLHGTDRSGNSVRFNARQVRSIPLRTSDGEVIGVSFPSKADDAEELRQWARMPTRNAAIKYQDVEKIPTDDGDGVKHMWAFGPYVATPWADRDTIYAHAHGTATSYDVKVTIRTPFRRRSTIVSLDGTEYGKLLEANRYFTRAAGATKDKDLVLISCNAGSPDGSALEGTAAHLHESGALTGSVHGFINEVIWPSNPVTGEANLGAAQVTGASGAPTSPIATVPPPTTGSDPP